MMRIYLDHNATSPLRPEAREAALAAMETLGNPSSVHAEGRAAKALLESARSRIAQGIGTARRNVTFTSGATEAANLALTPMLQRGKETAPFDLLLVGAGEHAAVLQGHRFPSSAVESVPLTPRGQLSLDALDAALARHPGKRLMLALQLVNNETGVIQPVREAAERVHAAGGVLICDATQAISRIETTFATTGADLLFFSSHKLGGPAGAGALAVARDELHISDKLLRGGGQEFGRRAGTENVAAIAGFAAAFEAALSATGKENPRLGELRGLIESQIAQIAPETRFFRGGSPPDGEHERFRDSRPQRPDAADVAGSRRGCGVERFGLFVGESAGIPRPCGDGGDRKSSFARQSGLVFAQRGCRTVWNGSCESRAPIEVAAIHRLERRTDRPAGLEPVVTRRKRNGGSSGDRCARRVHRRRRL